MITSINDWVAFLRDSHGVLAFPLIILGAALMFFGWRLWKICVMLSFGLIGAWAGYRLGGRDDGVFYSIVGALFLGLASAWPVRWSVAVLGGLIGGAVVYAYLDMIGLKGMTLWALGAAGWTLSTAYAVINRQQLVVVVTSFLGAVCAMSGVTAMIMSSPALFGTFRTMAENSMIVLPFILLVPTVMSCFYQMAEIKRLQIEVC